MGHGHPADGTGSQRLLWEAAQGELFHNDDTHMQVLELTTKKKNGEPIREDAPERKAVFTTGILSVSELRPQIALFFTGPNHSGENLRKVPQQRIAELVARAGNQVPTEPLGEVDLVPADSGNSPG